MFHVVLFEPEIPPNTGNIIRLCANTNCFLHLIEPLGFSIEDKHLRRAGLDYHHLANIKSYANFAEFCDTVSFRKLYALSSKVKTPYSSVKFQAGDAFLFGPETRGLPKEILSQFSEPEKLTIPQVTQSRSLNLSNSAAIIVYEALRQNSFNFLTEEI